MSRMTENQRMQFDRPDLKVPSTGGHVRSQRAMITTTVLGLLILGVLAFAAISGIDEWWQGLVFGVIVLTAVGMMIAVSPNRRG